MGLWVLLLIRCSTFTLLSDVGHITHTCTQQHSPLSVSPSLYRAPPRAEAFYLLVSSLLHKSHLLLVPSLLLSATDRRPRSHPSSNRGSDTTIGTVRGARGTVHIEARTTTQVRETPHFNPKP